MLVLYIYVLYFHALNDFNRRENLDKMSSVKHIVSNI